MDMNVYQKLAFSTANQLNDQHERLQRGVLGIMGEGGELAEHIKKHIYHGHPLKVEKLFEELGDVLWYVAVLAEQLGMPLNQIAAANLHKLNQRYSGKELNTEQSLHRDLKQERKAVEQMVAAIKGRADETETEG